MKIRWRGWVVVVISLIMLLLEVTFLTHTSQAIEPNQGTEQLHEKDKIEQAALATLNRFPTLLKADHKPFEVHEIEIEKDWAFLNLASLPTHVEPDAHFAQPDVLLAIAHKNKGEEWEVYLETMDEFKELITKVPDNLLSPKSKKILGSTVEQTTEALPTYSIPGLPWAVDTAWRYNQGPHGGNQGALDFGTPIRGNPTMVHAADEGVVIYSHETCLGIRRSGDDLRLWYQHIRHSDIDNWTVGDSVSFNQSIGLTTVERGCCDGIPVCTTGHHVHFYFDFLGQAVDPQGSSMNGWVLSGSQLIKDNTVANPNTNDTILHSNADTTPPTTRSSFSGTSGSNGWYRSNVQVTLSADDNEPVNWIRYRINSASSWTTYSNPFTISEEGRNTLEYRARDTSGNTEEIQSVAVKIDKGNPSSSCVPSPLSDNDWYSASPTIRCSGSDEVSDLAGIEYRVDGGAWQDYGGGFTLSGEGAHIVNYYAQDVAGNSQGQQSLRVNLDSVPPSVDSFTINDDAAVSHNRTALLMSEVSDDTSGVVEMCASYNQVEWECRAYEESTPFALPLIDLHTVTVYFYVIDAAGNQSEVVSDAIDLDFSPPMPHSANYRICQDVLNAAGQADLASGSYGVTSALGEPVVTESAGSSEHFRVQAGFLSNVDGCLPIERTIFGYRLQQSVMASGGDVRQSDSYRVGDTLGESVTSGEMTMQSASFKVSSGFWAQSTASDLVISVPFSVTIQGHPDAPDPSLVVPLRVSLTRSGEDTPAYEFTPTTDENGYFTLTGIQPGSYEIRVKHTQTLQNVQTVTLTAGSDLIGLGILREGDANDDNYVTIVDFSILAATFAKCEGATGYDERADFNGDGCITIRDFSLLASNFGQSGQRAPEESSGETSPLKLARQRIEGGRRASDVVMSISPAESTIKPGETFNVTVYLDAGSQQVDGAQIVLNFDPAILAVKEVMTGEQLELELANQFDNQGGSIQFAAGALTDFPSGAIDVMDIQFEALEEGETALTFSVEGAIGSDVTFGGASVLGEVADGVVKVSEPTAVRVQELAAPATVGWLWALAPLALTMLAGAWISRRRG